MKKKEWTDCICYNQNIHSIECRSNHRRNQLNRSKKELKEKLRKEHRCFKCKKLLKPKIIYFDYCDEHLKERRIYNQKYLRNKKI